MMVRIPESDHVYLSLYPEVHSVRGPYLRGDGRRFVSIRNKDGSKSTKQYCRYLYEVNYAVKLSPNDTVDHIDRDFTNDEISNLQILDRKMHGEKDARRRKMDIKDECRWCGKTIALTRSQLSNSQRKGNTKGGPFCSRECSGKYGSAIQNGNS